MGHEWVQVFHSSAHYDCALERRATIICTHSCTNQETDSSPAPNYQSSLPAQCFCHLTRLGRRYAASIIICQSKMLVLMSIHMLNYLPFPVSWWRSIISTASLTAKSLESVHALPCQTWHQRFESLSVSHHMIKLNNYTIWELTGFTTQFSYTDLSLYWY